MPRIRPMLFLDLDGVFVDFEGGFRAIFGVGPKDIDEVEMWKLVERRPSFFEELPLFDGALDFYYAVRPLYPMFLTAAPKTGYAQAARAKRRYVHGHIDPEVIALPVPGGSNKPVFMQHPGAVLVDDYERNCDLWTDEGGVAVLHGGDFAVTLAALEAIYGPHAEW